MFKLPTEVETGKWKKTHIQIIRIRSCRYMEKGTKLEFGNCEGKPVLYGTKIFYF
jgi:hypothetical protein